MAKRAVLIGVNRYQMPGADLRGCVNDIKNMQATLTQRYGFKKQDIVTLVDLAASQKAIQSAIQTLVRKGRRGDVLLVHFSGHGSNVPDDDDNRYEADGRDEHDQQGDDPHPAEDDLPRVVGAPAHPARQPSCRESLVRRAPVAARIVSDGVVRHVLPPRLRSPYDG